MTDATALENLLKRERAVVLAGLAGTTALAWIYLFRMAAAMDDMSGAVSEAMLAARLTPWTPVDLALMFVMWAVMMVAMMLPSAAPMILLFATVNRRQKTRGAVVAPTGLFAAGYVAVWTLFSLGATGLQWTLQRGGLLSPMMATTSSVLGGAVLLTAGVYQWTPLKGACLTHCRSPIHFITQHWQPGRAGAFRMGWDHGLYCLGCCWFLMCLLFVGGVMNLVWIAGLAIFVLLEKVLPLEWVPQVSGAALVVWGLAVLLGSA